jgi:hypothetical protein
MTPREVDRRPARVRAHALFAVALLTATALVRVPLELYGGSALDFTSASRDLLFAIFAAGLLLFALLTLIVVSLPARLRSHADTALVGLASYAWIRSGFFPGPSVNLDGTRLDVDLSTGLAGLLLPLAGAVFLAWLGTRQRRVVTTLLAVLLGGSLVQAIVVAASTWRSRPPASAAAVACVLEWSRKGNVLVLILDTLQSDIFQDVLEAQPGLRQQLDGFRYYRYASSNSPTTYLSLPTIHSGQLYDPNESAWVFYNQVVREHSVLNRFAAAGYEASYASGIGICPNAVANCPRTLDLARSRGEVAVQEASQLLDLGVYRILPDGLRARILEHGHGPIGAMVGRAYLVERAEAEAAALERLAQSSFATDSRPTAKIFHSMLTHPPTVLRPDCSLGERREDREGAAHQTMCAFKQIVALFERLRTERAYDVSNLIVIGDHGYGFHSRFAVASQDPRFRRMVGAFNPVVLVKPAGAHGPLTTSDAPIELADVPKALCGGAGCAPAEGLLELDAVDAARTRVAFWYLWKNEYWRLPQIPGLVPYSIRGDIREPASWWREAAAYTPGTVIDFRRGQNAAQYLGFGWGRRQPTHTWVVDPGATVRLRARFEPNRDHLLVLAAPLLEPLPSDSRRVGVEVNGVALAELSCADPARRPSSYQLRIPASVLSRSPETTISFRTKQRGTHSEADSLDPCLALQTLELRPAP